MCNLFLELNFQGNDLTLRIKSLKLKRLFVKYQLLSNKLDATIFIVFSPICETLGNFKHPNLRQYRMEDEL